MGPSHSEKLDNANFIRIASSVARSAAERPASADRGIADGSHRVRTRQLRAALPPPCASGVNT